MLSIYLPTLVASVARNGVTLLLPLYALEVADSAFVAASVLAMQAAGTMLSDVPSGSLIARLGDKTVMMIGLTILSTTAAVAALTTSPFMLAIVASGFGVGGAAWIMGRLVNITERVQLHHRGRVISVLGGTERAGKLIGPLMAGVTAQHLGYHIAFFVIAAALAFSVLICFIFTQRTRVRTFPQKEINVLQILSKHSEAFLRTGPVVTALSFLRHARGLIVPIWGVAIGLDPSAIGLVITIAAVVELAMFAPAGLILDHIGRKAALIPCMTLLSLSIVLLPFTGQFWSFVAVVVLAGIGNGFGTGIFMTIGSDLAPRYGRSRFLGVWRLIGDAGGVSGPFVVGAVASSLSMIAACALAGSIGVVGALLAIAFIPEPNRHRRKT